MHHLLKQFIRGKPIRLGYKFWALCDSSSYCFNFNLYCGKNLSDQRKGSYVFLKTLDAIEEIQSHTAFFDNFFTSYQLLIHLKSFGFQAKENIKDNGLRKGPLTDKKQ